ncbi:ABC transporter permease [Pseudobacteriovorax antillogorgiicola]|uniref:ABC-type multidrug transport system, permease component n=1 Tax=Pseudobacteriovorax antillogorgiicola TaxID=1513793 RepID=A0A1Y6C7C3_9BACT|nr:ABC transporter permease [Pseudobacteriovorax antillogorgiicola]TCS49500.1 ABC-type multidrug transport system permease subunit [Pseudobacteriovorax antillogorgiicola]SMF45892.1 ABC-type multidrug transport system, permease component [Pseudobacteriovorax antillogorgiicola]
MLSPSLKEQIKCRWREFRREPSAFFWVMFMPILWMVALGFAFSEPKPEVYGVGWSTNSQSESGEEYRQAIADHPQVRLKMFDEATLMTLIKRGDVSLIAKWDGQQVVYQFDPRNPEAQRARDFVNNIVQQKAGRTDPLPAANEEIIAKGSRYVDFLIPGLLGLSIMTSSLFGVGMTIVSNRKENLLKRYIATPMRPWEYVVSHIFGRYMVLAFEFSAVMICGFLLFDFKVFGNLGSYLFVAILGAGAFTAISLTCAARTKSIPTIGGVVNLITLPMMMLSGVFFSKNNFPESFQTIIDFLPLTALNDALRKIALEGQGLAQVGFELGVLAVYLVVGTVVSNRLFKWY